MILSSQKKPKTSETPYFFVSKMGIFRQFWRDVFIILGAWRGEGLIGLGGLILGVLIVRPINEFEPLWMPTDPDCQNGNENVHFGSLNVQSQPTKPPRVFLGVFDPVATCGIPAPGKKTQYRMVTTWEKANWSVTPKMRPICVLCVYIHLYM